MPYPSLPPLRSPQAAFHAELLRAAVSPDEALAGAALWPCFAGYYQALARLPRKMRRALQRQWRRSLGGLALLLALGQAPALATTLNVDGVSCTLVDAIRAANSAQPVGGCPAGIGADTIVLSPGSTHTLTEVVDTTYQTGLPVITSTITIEGNGSTITRAPTAPAFRLLSVANGRSLTLQDTTLSGGVADSGGAVSTGGTLSLLRCTVTGNSASLLGGGVDGGAGSTVTLANSTVSANSAGFNGGGGGVATRGGTIILTESTVSGNSGYLRGGGVYNFRPPDLTDSPSPFDSGKARA